MNHINLENYSLSATNMIMFASTQYDKNNDFVYVPRDMTREEYDYVTEQLLLLKRYKYGQ